MEPADGSVYIADCWNDRVQKFRGSLPPNLAVRVQSHSYRAALEAILDGNLRIFCRHYSRTVDTAAYEYGSWHFKFRRLERVADGAVKLTSTGRGRREFIYTVWHAYDLGVGIPGLYLASRFTSVPWTDTNATGRVRFDRTEFH